MKGSSLIGLCVVVLLASVAFAQDAEYVSNSKCKMCHNKEDQGKIWDVWKSKAHSKAFATLQTDAAKEAAKAAGVEGEPSEAPACLKCHVTAYDVEKKAAPEAIKPEDGVQCESCHGPASLHMDDAKKKMKKEEVDMAAHIGHPKKEACAQCHNDGSPTWNPERYTLDDGTKKGFDFDKAWEKIKHGKAK